MEKGEPRRPPAKPQFAAGVPASPQWEHDFTLTGEKVADRYAAVGYLEISVVRGGGRMLDPSSTPSASAPREIILRSTRHGRETQAESKNVLEGANRVTATLVKL